MSASRIRDAPVENPGVVTGLPQVAHGGKGFSQRNRVMRQRSHPVLCHNREEQTGFAPTRDLHGRDGRFNTRPSIQPN